MTTAVHLPQDLLSKLKALADPFVDTTPIAVIEKLVDAELSRRGGQGGSTTPSVDLPRLDPDDHESLTHTRVKSASVEGKAIHRPKWNSLLDHLHVLGRERLGSFEKLDRETAANLREGRYEEAGYKYLEEGGFSIQGVDANLAWDHSLRLARALNVPIVVTFEWRRKDAAERPGETAVLEWTP